MESTLQSIGYVDTFRHKLDARSRSSMPSQWRVSGDEGSYYMAWPHPDGCIAVYPPEMQQEFLEKSKSIKQSDRRGQLALQKFFGAATKLGCDKQGRLLLSDKLKAHAAIEKDVVFVGTGRNFQIWSPARYDVPETDDFDLLEAMDELGF